MFMSSFAVAGNCSRQLLLLCVGIMLSLVSAQAAETDIDIPFQKFVLDNGLRVIVHEDHKSPIVAVGVWYHVGSKDEPQGKTGFAHLFEHIMFEGSEHYNDRFSKPLDQVGATSLNGTTWLDRTNYFETVPTPALDLALWLESDRMGHLLGVVTQEKLDHVRGVVQNEKRQRQNEPYGKVYYRVLEGLFPAGHPYSHPTIGSMEDLDAASLEEIHQWFRDYYGAANTVLVMAGDITPEKARELAEKYFGDIPAGPPLTRMKSWVPALDDDKREVMFDRVSQIRSYRLWSAPGWTSRDRSLLQLAASVLGEGKNSRLYQALVYEYPHAVEISVEIQPFELASLFSIEVTLSNDATLQQVDTIIDQELEKFIQNGPGAIELERARNRINAATIRGLERVGGFYGKASTLAQSELYDGNPDFFKTAISWINNASAEEVREASERWLSRNVFQLDVLPFGEHKTVETGVDRKAGRPAVAELPDLAFPPIQRARLSNGMNVVLAERTAIPMVSVSLQFDAGFAADPHLKSGTASFTLAMMDESTRSRSSLEIDAEAELLGAVISTESDLDTSRITLSALRENLAGSISLFADVVRNPAFTNLELERMRPRWLARIEREKNQPLSLALRTLPPLIYGQDHAYGIPFTGSGTEEAIKVISREDLANFHRLWIRPDNGTVFVAGDTTLDEVLPLLEKAFGDWRTPKTPVPEKTIARVPFPASSRMIIIDKPGAPQSLILAAHVAPSTRAENHIGIELMNDVIGGQFASRVNQNLRAAKHWSYGAYTIFRDARGQRPWIVYAPVQTDRTADAVRELLSEFEQFLDTRPASEGELARVFNSNAYSLPGQYETTGSVLAAMQANERFGRPDDYVSDLKQKYEAVNLDAIRAAAGQVLHPDLLTWVVVGDRSKIETELQNLGIADLEFMNERGQLLEAGQKTN
jgi:zinc protease